MLVRLHVFPFVGVHVVVVVDVFAVIASIPVDLAVCVRSGVDISRFVPNTVETAICHLQHEKRKESYSKMIYFKTWLQHLHEVRSDAAMSMESFFLATAFTTGTV